MLKKNKEEWIKYINLLNEKLKLRENDELSITIKLNEIIIKKLNEFDDKYDLIKNYYVDHMHNLYGLIDIFKEINKIIDNIGFKEQDFINDGYVYVFSDGKFNCNNYQRLILSEIYFEYDFIKHVYQMQREKMLKDKLVVKEEIIKTRRKIWVKRRKRMDLNDFFAQLMKDNEKYNIVSNALEFLSKEHKMMRLDEKEIMMLGVCLSYSISKSIDKDFKDFCNNYFRMYHFVINNKKE